LRPAPRELVDKEKKILVKKIEFATTKLMQRKSLRKNRDPKGPRFSQNEENKMFISQVHL
jgi:hypothetical protein